MNFQKYLKPSQKVSACFAHIIIFAGDKLFKLTFPREFAVNGKRLKIVHNIQELSNEINNYIDGNNLYTTVYSFRQTNGTKAIYSTAIVDRILIDIDNKDSKGNPVDAKEQVHKIANYLLTKNYFFNINFSGRGFHIYIYTKTISGGGAVKNYVAELVQRTGAIVDTSVVGDLAREVRILNTINQKSKLYCIPIKIDEIDSAESLAVRPRKLDKSFLYGSTLLDLQPYQQGIVENFNYSGFSHITLRSSFDINTDYVINMLKQVPCIKEVLDNSYAGWQERTLLLLFLKENGYSLEDAQKIVKAFIAKDKYETSTCTRNHAAAIYSRSYKLPSCSTINKIGLCPLADQKKCLFYNKLNDFNSVLEYSKNILKKNGD